ncbi:DUF551 domain-containing protein [Citrobacter europaeus]|uniref:DUF551 domain-containing protein n=1 Tax=Citrobacter europaeus TaxID=1914243 RepID=UPI0030D3AD2E
MKTNNHPAHGPVSLDRLHQIREHLLHDNQYSNGGNRAYILADMLNVIDEVLASRNAEPVFFIEVDGDDWIQAGRIPGSTFDFNNLPDGVNKLWASPQPAAVVPENCVTAEHRRVIEMLLNVCGAAFELADDSCQQDVDGEECHAVPDDAFQKLSDALNEIENTLPTEDVDRPDVFLAWSAMPRAALKSILQAGNSPVTPDGWIPVSERMPKRDVDVQVYCADKKEQMVAYMERNEGEGWFRFASLPNGGGVYCKPTHWMSLPAEPQQEVKS